MFHFLRHIDRQAIVLIMLGEPDVGYVSLTEMTFALRNICNAVTIPVVSDGDTGYGNAMNNLMEKCMILPTRVKFGYPYHKFLQWR